VFDKAGFESTHQTKKVAEFRSRTNSRYIYVVKEKLVRNAIHLAVEEQVTTEQSWIPPGVKVGDRYHLSNMKNFDARLHTGKKPTHFGSSIHIDTLSSLSDLLRQFNELP
jgi:hypothetical protein